MTRAQVKFRFTQSKITKYRPPPDGPTDFEVTNADMPGFKARYRKNAAGVYGPGNYYARDNIGDTDIKQPLGRIDKVPLAEAMADAGKVFALAARAINPVVERAKTIVQVNDTIADNIDPFLAHLRDQGRGEEHIDAAGRALRKYLAPLGHFNSNDVTTKMIVDQLDRIKKDVARRRKSVSGKSTADHCRSHASGFFRWLIQQGTHVGTNPVQPTAMNGRTPREKVPTADEMRLIFGALPPVGDDYGDIVRLLFLLGPRKSEVAELTRAEVNFKEKRLEIPGWRDGERRTKSGRDFWVPLSRPALAILAPRASRTGLMFGHGQCVFSAWSWYKARLDEKSGVRGWVLHDTRRLMASHMAEKKYFDPPIPPHIIEVLQGHVIGGSTRDTYNKSQYVEEKREALERWATYLLKMVEAKPVRQPRRSKRRSKQEVAASAL